MRSLNLGATIEKGKEEVQIGLASERVLVSEFRSST